MLKVVFTGGPADGATHDYPRVDVALSWVHLIDYTTGRTTAVYQRLDQQPRADGRWAYGMVDDLRRTAVANAPHR